MQGSFGANITTMDRYSLGAIIGSGGFGSVYRAIHVHTKQVVALKVLNAAAIESGIAAKNLVREAQILATIRHPNIVQVYDAGIVDGIAFFAMELVEGITLDSMLEREGPLPIGRAMPIASQLLEGLAAAHAASAVHRDIKPQNIVMTPDGTLKILDFGISKSSLVQASSATQRHWIGSPGYMAPEQYGNGAVDLRADLYAAGVTLFEMLTGRCPFEAESFAALFDKTMRERAPLVSQFAPTTPEPVVRAIDRALSRDPDARFASALQFRDALLASEVRYSSATPLDLDACVRMRETPPQFAATPLVRAPDSPIIQAPINMRVGGEDFPINVHHTQVRQPNAYGAAREAPKAKNTKRRVHLAFIGFGALCGLAALLVAVFYLSADGSTSHPRETNGAKLVVLASAVVVRTGTFSTTQRCVDTDSLRYENATIRVASGAGFVISDVCVLELVNTTIEAPFGIQGDMGDVIIRGGKIVARTAAIQISGSTELTIEKTEITAISALQLGGPANVRLTDVSIVAEDRAIVASLSTLTIVRGTIRGRSAVVIDGPGSLRLDHAHLIGTEAAVSLSSIVDTDYTSPIFEGIVSGGHSIPSNPDSVLKTISKRH